MTTSAAPQTLRAWQAGLVTSADRLVSVAESERPARAGNLAGALRACAAGRHYSSRGVTHNPDLPLAIVITASNGTLEEIQARVKALELDAIANITYRHGAVGKQSTLTLTPHPRPAP